MILTQVVAYAGGWDGAKGLAKVTLSGELVCAGCTLKKMDGANAQCNLFAQHTIGFRLGDGTLWSIIDNLEGHDITRGHGLVDNKKATITGYLYPVAHMIEIESIAVEKVDKKDIAHHAWSQDQKLAKALLSRKAGEPPVFPEEKGSSTHSWVP
jgi:hypothetical protein